MSWACGFCGREFDSKRAVSVHKTATHDSDKQYTDADTLERLYREEGKSMREVAEELDTDHDRVAYWLDVHDIDSRTALNDLGYAPYKSNRQGYPLWKTHVEGTRHRVKVHRLLAVAEYGFDAVADCDVHHKNGVRWDNRPSNVKPMSPSEHRREHGLQRRDEQRELMAELREKGKLDGGDASV